MTVHKKPVQIIGRAEPVSFVELGGRGVHARIDTGARTSAIWGEAEIMHDGRLKVTFFADESAVGIFDHFDTMVVAPSNGVPDERYVVELAVRLAGRRVRARFTIANRSTQVYPVLIGRNVLRGKFIVDVRAGKALIGAENKRIRELQSKKEKKA